MGQISPDTVLMVADVVIAAELSDEVGRTGATPVVVPVAVVGEVELVEDEVLEVLEAPGDVGQSVSPHSRSVGQQPPPRLTGHARNKVEHAKVV